ncbi:hypothetical protein [Symmachiella dynata]|uniref:hypothetical protein n=1 Tax=Symmachiella dynata TaxID=2527995 RepID=UPI0030EC0599
MTGETCSNRSGDVVGMMEFKRIGCYSTRSGADWRGAIGSNGWLHAKTPRV